MKTAINLKLSKSNDSFGYLSSGGAVQAIPHTQGNSKGLVFCEPL